MKNLKFTFNQPQLGTRNQFNTLQNIYSESILYDAALLKFPPQKSDVIKESTIANENMPQKSLK